MFKKLLATVCATSALSIPLAAVASSDPGADNPGVPGNVIDSSPPGNIISPIAKGPGSVTDQVESLTGGEFKTPGQALVDANLPH